MLKKKSMLKVICHPERIPLCIPFPRELQEPRDWLVSEAAGDPRFFLFKVIRRVYACAVGILLNIGCMLFTVVGLPCFILRKIHDFGKAAGACEEKIRSDLEYDRQQRTIEALQKQLANTESTHFADKLPLHGRIVNLEFLNRKLTAENAELKNANETERRLRLAAHDENRLLRTRSTNVIEFARVLASSPSSL